MPEWDCSTWPYDSVWKGRAYPNREWLTEVFLVLCLFFAAHCSKNLWFSPPSCKFVRIHLNFNIQRPRNNTKMSIALFEIPCWVHLLCFVWRKDNRLRGARSTSLTHLHSPPCSSTVLLFGGDFYRQVTQEIPNSCDWVCRHIEQAWLDLRGQKKFVADKRINHFLIWNNLVPSTYEKTHQ